MIGGRQVSDGARNRREHRVVDLGAVRGVARSDATCKKQHEAVTHRSAGRDGLEPFLERRHFHRAPLEPINALSGRVEGREAGPRRLPRRAEVTANAQGTGARPPRGLRHPRPEAATPRDGRSTAQDACRAYKLRVGWVEEAAGAEEDRPPEESRVPSEREQSRH